MLSTLRARLALWHLAVLLVTLTVFAGLLYAVLANSLHHHHDDELAGQATAVATFLRSRVLSDEVVKEALRAAQVSSRFVMIRTHDGELRFREPALQETEPNIGRHAVLTHIAMARPAAPEFFTVELERSGAVRFVCIPLTQTDLFLQMGHPIGDVRTALDTLRDSSLLLIPAVLLLSSLASWLLAKRALQPVRVMDATLREIEASDLSKRVEVQARDREIAGLVETVNKLLDRLQRAFVSLQQFAGDVSHQLQTPLTVMKSSVESRGRSNTTPDKEWLAGQAEQIDAMSATIRALRSLAVADEPPPASSIDFAAVVEESADIIAALGEPKEIAVRKTVAAGVSVKGDAIRLRQVVLNLGENAVSYTPLGGRVDIVLTAEPERAVLQVTDTGVGIGEDEQQRIFDRSYRGRASNRGQGAGLGLAIAKRIVDAHGGTLNVTSSPGAGTTFTVVLPYR